MKNIKIILLLFLSIILVACGSENKPNELIKEKSAAELYRTVLDNYATLEALELEITSTALDGKANNDTSTNHIITKNIMSVEKAEYYSTSDIRDSHVESYIKDGFEYININGVKTKKPYKPRVTNIADYNLMRLMDDDTFYDKLVVEQKKNKFIFTLHVDTPEEAEKLVAGLNPAYIQSLKQTQEKVVFNQFNLYVVANQNLELISSTDMFEATFADNIKIKMETTLEVKATGDNVKFEFPNFDDYLEAQE